MKPLSFALIAAAVVTTMAFLAAPWQSARAIHASEAFPETGVFAGGCFWCIEADFEKLDGVGNVISGYSGGALQNPTYKNHPGHIEVVEVPFDPDIISYRELTDYFFRHVDPLDDGGQFCDRGHSYTTAIFYADETQRAIAEAAKADAELALGETIVTPIRALDQFWIAEDYHQDYYKKNPVRYKFYRTGCGRDRRVKQVWGE
ncbi:MAG: peptide-methionine (S)-S-oxide reductase MsrA [Pseudomonadota bacterium]